MILKAGGTSFWVAEIVDMWLDRYQEPWIGCRWYYLPEETRYGRLPHHHPAEVFETAHCDENSVSAIQVLARSTLLSHAIAGCLGCLDSYVWSVFGSSG